jgi:hypothetical protein
VRFGYSGDDDDDDDDDDEHVTLYSKQNGFLA